VTRAKWEIRKINRRIQQAGRDFAPAVRAGLVIRAPPPVLLDTGHCARIDRCASLAWRSLFDK